MADVTLVAGSQLAQVRPSATTTTTLFTATMGTEITRIFVANTTTSAATASLYHDDDGTTYSEATTIGFDLNIPPKSVMEYVSDTIGAGIKVSKSGTLGCRSGTASALTFTVYGVTESR